MEWDIAFHASHFDWNCLHSSINNRGALSTTFNAEFSSNLEHILSCRFKIQRRDITFCTQLQVERKKVPLGKIHIYSRLSVWSENQSSTKRNTAFKSTSSKHTERKKERERNRKRERDDLSVRRSTRVRGDPLEAYWPDWLRTVTRINYDVITSLTITIGGQNGRQIGSPRSSRVGGKDRGERELSVRASKPTGKTETELQAWTKEEIRYIRRIRRRRKLWKSRKRTVDLREKRRENSRTRSYKRNAVDAKKHVTLCLWSKEYYADSSRAQTMQSSSSRKS